MSVVIDANVLAALALPLPYSEHAVRKVTAWKQVGVDLFAPSLLEYEVTTIIRKAVVAKLLSADDAVHALRKIFDLNVQSVAPTVTQHEKALQWAAKLGQKQAYDAQYLALAQQMRINFWTADKRLANNAQQVGASWVRLIEQVDVEN
ncbi:MAG: type II toxin-antitoxin system VapC family toxin [Anaerolineaceae bacterium]|jgi:predicted nucleic acid-binding protein|nr:type II toxin-antitoxin system VapC family toxin [Anaerolineaceae bacterium]